MSSFFERASQTPITFLIAIAYVTIALATPATEDPFAMNSIEKAAAAIPLFIQEGEVWRLLSYSFLHGGMLHLALNTIFLVILAPMLEQRLGTARFIGLYIAGAIGGGIGGSLWHPVFTPLVGGSGALFAMMGAALALNMRLGRHLFDFMSHQAGRGLISLLVINLALGMFIPQVSNAGHIGGLIAGFALTFCFLERGRTPADTTARVVQAGWAALFASLIFYCCFPVLRFDYQARMYWQATDPEVREQFRDACLHNGLGPGDLSLDHPDPMWQDIQRRWSRQIPPQAQPVFAWFDAVKRGDRQQLERVFSARMRARFDKQGWDEVMRRYQSVFEHQFGDYRLETFTFEFTGGEAEGRVAIVYGDKKFPGVKVIKEDADWKVNEL